MKEQAAVEIPKIIHFVWAGGVNPLPTDSIDVIAEWARENKEFAVFLWVDAETSGKSFEQLRTEYLEDFKERGLGEDKLNIRDIREVYAETARHSEPNCPMIDDCSQYEIERLKPN